MEDEGAVLPAAEATVERDQLLERAALVELGVVEAVHHDVGDVGETVGPPQVERCGGRERRQWILALDPAVREVVRPARAERNRAVLPRADQQEADVRMLPECREQLRM